MRLKISKKSKDNSRYTKLFVLAAALYVGVFVGVFTLLKNQTNEQIGQLISGQSSGVSLINLDLNVAAKNHYPSSAIMVTQDLGNNSGVTEKIVSFKVADDNLNEYGLMMLPATPQPQHGYPVIILCHGYANPDIYRTTTGYINDMVFYASHGFAVIKPDYRGQGLSSDQGLPDSAYYSMAYNTDVMSLISAVKQTKYLDKKQINLWGHSMGAYIALRATVLSADIKNVVLLSGPVDSLSKMYLSYVPPSDENNLDALLTRKRVFDKYGIPSDSNPFWINSSPINSVSKIKAHIQIHVGAQDQIVPPQFSADLDAALSKLHIKHEHYVYSDAGHGLASKRPQIWERSLKLFNANKDTVLPSA